MFRGSLSLGVPFSFSNMPNTGLTFKKYWHYKISAEIEGVISSERATSSFERGLSLFLFFLDKSTLFFFLISSRKSSTSIVTFSCFLRPGQSFFSRELFCLNLPLRGNLPSYVALMYLLNSIATFWMSIPHSELSISTIARIVSSGW